MVVDFDSVVAQGTLSRESFERVFTRVVGALLTAGRHETLLITVQAAQGAALDRAVIDEVQRGFDDLAATVRDISTRPSLAIRSPGMLTLARQAVESLERSDTADVRAWADRLARDVSEHND